MLLKCNGGIRVPQCMRSSGAAPLPSAVRHDAGGFEAEQGRSEVVERIEPLDLVRGCTQGYRPHTRRLCAASEPVRRGVQVLDLHRSAHCCSDCGVGCLLGKRTVVSATVAARHLR